MTYCENKHHCKCCGFEITCEENFFYTSICEKCTRNQFERVEAWRLGHTDDPQLDQHFGAKPKQQPVNMRIAQIADMVNDGNGNWIIKHILNVMPDNGKVH